MKYIPSFLLVMLCVISQVAKADDVPEIVKRDGSSVQWHWTETALNNGILHGVDFTQMQKNSDGKIYLPYAQMQQSTKKWLTATLWLRIDCDKMTLEDLGSYSNGLFTRAVPFVYADNSIEALPKYMICGVMSDKNEKIYGFGVSLTADSYVSYGWMPKTLKKSDIEGFIEFPAYPYVPSTGVTGTPTAWITNCTSGALAAKDGPGSLNVNENGARFKYLHNSVCSYYNANYKNIPNSSSNIQQESPVVESFTKPSITMDNAKSKCTDLGFKPKTEKFGKCVLELTK